MNPYIYIYIYIYIIKISTSIHVCVKNSLDMKYQMKVLKLKRLC